jgi:hypothetical protein
MTERVNGASHTAHACIIDAASPSYRTSLLALSVKLEGTGQFTLVQNGGRGIEHDRSWLAWPLHDDKTPDRNDSTHTTHSLFRLHPWHIPNAFSFVHANAANNRPVRYILYVLARPMLGRSLECMFRGLGYISGSFSLSCLHRCSSKQQTKQFLHGQRVRKFPVLLSCRMAYRCGNVVRG